MKKSKIYSIFTLLLSILVLAGVMLSHLALTDIYHGVDPNLDTEWWVVRVTFIFVIVLAVASMAISLNKIRKDD